MKKILSLLFAFAFLFSAGCNRNNGGTNSSKDNATSSIESATETEEEYNGGVQLQKVKPLPYDSLLSQKNSVPTVETTTRCEVDGVTAIEFTGADYKGESTKVFAYVGMPDVPSNEKVPAVVLVHGGGGTAFRNG